MSTDYYLKTLKKYFYHGPRMYKTAGHRGLSTSGSVQLTNKYSFFLQFVTPESISGFLPFCVEGRQHAADETCSRGVFCRSCPGRRRRLVEAPKEEAL